jgi:hypothetical protein
VVVTEKIDGTNAQIYIANFAEVDESILSEAVGCHGGDYIFAGSRNRFVSPGKKDNFGFAGWVWENKDELFALGPGRHFGEWWGRGIQRTYGLDEKRFSLFNVGRWLDPHLVYRLLDHDERVLAPNCCHVVPVLGTMETINADWVDDIVDELRDSGSKAAPGFDKPEGVMVFHTAGNVGFKVTLENDDKPKGLVNG